jgi:hypothetical protein
MHGDSGAFVEVGLKLGSSRKYIQDILQSPNVSHLSPHHKQCIIRILQYRAATFHDGVEDKPVSLDQTLEDISHEEEQVQGQGISLPQPSFAINPGTGVAVHHDCRP